jgi:hypothetical protein
MTTPQDPTGSEPPHDEAARPSPETDPRPPAAAESSRPVPVDPPAASVVDPAQPRNTLSALILLIVLLVASLVVLDQRQVADAWRQQAGTLAEQRDQAIGRTEALGAELTEISEQLQRAIDERENLETRLAALAEEKARAEDTTAVSSEQLQELARIVGSAVSQLNTCVADVLQLQSDTVAAYNSLARGTPVDTTRLQERQNSISAQCAEAQRAGAFAVGAANQLR